MAFEHDHGLPLTGEASEALLKRILLGAAAAAPTPGRSARSSSAQAEQVIRAGAAVAGGARLSARPHRRPARRGHRQGHPRVRDGQGAGAQGARLGRAGGALSEAAAPKPPGRLTLAAVAQLARRAAALQWRPHAPQSGNLGEGLPAPLPGRGRGRRAGAARRYAMPAPSTSRSAGSTAPPRCSARRPPASMRRARTGAGSPASTRERARGGSRRLPRAPDRVRSRHLDRVGRGSPGPPLPRRLAGPSLSRTSLVRSINNPLTPVAFKWGDSPRIRARRAMGEAEARERATARGTRWQ